MGNPAQSSQESTLRPLDMTEEMRSVAALFDRVDGGEDILQLLRDRPGYAEAYRHLLKRSYTSFDAAYPGVMRKPAPLSVWKKAGFERVAEFMQILKLRAL